MRKTLKERFFEKIKVLPSGCHEWTGCLLKSGQRTTGGYGQININGVARYAHRISWELHHGEIPDGAYILHKCDNRQCVNVEHLYLGSHDENMQDMTTKGRQCEGIKNPHAKLDEAAVIAIRASSKKHLEIANQYGVTQSLVSMIKSRRIWKHI